MFPKAFFVTALFVSASVAAAPASKFLSDGIKGDNGEIRLGALIASRGHTQAVRSFGKTLERDHSTARGQAVAVARSMHVSVPTSISPEARSEYAKLERLRGLAFDREVRRCMIEDHQKDIAKFEQQARSGDRRTAALAREQLMTLRKHLSIAQSLSV